MGSMSFQDTVLFMIDFLCNPFVVSYFNLFQPHTVATFFAFSKLSGEATTGTELSKHC